MADFSGSGANGALLGTHAITVNGITAESGILVGGTFDATGTELYQRNAIGDRGLGVCSVPEVCVGTNDDEIVELDAEEPGGIEVIRLSKPDESTWESVWLSSLDGAEAGNLYWSDDGVNFLGNLITAYQHTAGLAEQVIFIPTPFANVRYLIFQADSGVSGDSDHYVWKAVLNQTQGNTPAGTDVLVEPAVALPDGTEAILSLTFDSVDTAGNTTVTASSNGPPPATGFKLGNPPIYYEITTTAAFSGNVSVCINWSDGQFANESNIRLFHQENSNWLDITDPTSRDTVNNTVCGITTSLSPFALMEVKYPFAGFFQPVDNLPVVNSVKAGAAVPVKFSLGGDLGLNIFAPGYPRAELIQCETGSTIDNIETIVTAGGSSLNYDALTGQYTYVWKTNQAWAGSCRVLQVRFNDGEEYSARFSMRK